ncbi:MAG: crossover junction endodeoxyribonuclease RuvC [Deltaproteobacteria bacterium]|nr:crossover junction endodeoxyribonuclease RuvC [Deltaproteobacteria bacterium]
MKVLGIDPGSRITGYGVVEHLGGNRFARISSGVVSAKSSATLSEKLLQISKGLQVVIGEFTPDVVAIESVFFAKNVKSAITLGHARGVALLSAAEAGLGVFEYAPTTIKQAVSGYGGASKDQVQKMIKALLRLDEALKPDEADALAIAICHINHLGPLAQSSVAS